LEVVLPEGSNPLLSSDVPNCEGDALELDLFHVETYGGNSSDQLSQLQFVQDGCLSGAVESKHQNAHALICSEKAPEASEDESHSGQSVDSRVSVRPTVSHL
ncbi:hypothetical protein PENTCL1PPCAC_16753, partial [Pristionchus entomophagus]